MGRRRSGHGPAFRFSDPFGRVFEICRETCRYRAPEAERPALENLAQRCRGCGCCLRRIDRANPLAGDADAVRRFAQTCLGSWMSETIRLDDGRLGGCRFAVKNETCDLA